MSQPNPEPERDPKSDRQPPPPPERRTIVIVSDIGSRTDQQDASNSWENPAKCTALIVVCDGVGGSRSGGEASALVVRTAEELWASRDGDFTDAKVDLFSLARVAHRRIVDLAAAGEKRPPASTLAALYLTPTQAHWIHSGDTRIYHFRGGQLMSRTRDHSVVQVLVDQGEVDEAAMGDHPDQGRLLQSLGTRDYREPVYQTAAIGREDGFVLCTDGFWERTPPASLVTLLGSAPDHFSESLRKTVAQAVEANGPSSDNVTAAAVAPLERTVLPVPLLLEKRWLVILAIAVAAGIAIGAWLGLKPKGNPDPKSSKEKTTTGAEVQPLAPTKLPENRNAKANAPAAKPAPEAAPDPELVPDKALIDEDITFKPIQGRRFLSFSITVGAWNRFMTKKDWRNETLANFVKNVTYEQASAFADTLTKRLHEKNPEFTDWTYRIPTKEEWKAGKDDGLTGGERELIDSEGAPTVTGSKGKPEDGVPPPDTKIKKDEPSGDDTVFRVVLVKKK